MHSDQETDYRERDMIRALAVIGEPRKPLRALLTKDLAWTLEELKNTIYRGIVDTILSGEEKNAEWPVEECISFVQECVERILREQSREYIDTQLSRTEHKLRASLEKSHILIESLRLVEEYLQNFCKKYPPKRIPNWEMSADDLYYTDDYDNSDEYAVWKHDLGWWEDMREEEVTPREKNMFLRSLDVIRNYIRSLSTVLITDPPRQPDFLQTYQRVAADKFTTMKHSMDILDNILRWADTSDPYHTLCQNRGQSQYDIATDIFDALQTWEQICRHLDLNAQ